MDGLDALGAMLGSSVGLWAAMQAVAPSREEARTTLRCALFFAWASLTGEIATGLGRGLALAGSVPPLDGIMTAGLVFASLALVGHRLPESRRAPFAALSIAALMGVLQLLLETKASGATLAVRATCASLGLWLLRSMRERRHAGARAALHALAFVSTLSFLAPLTVLFIVRRTLAWPETSVSKSAVVVSLVMGATALGIASARAFVRVGGTPDPLDPPPRLVTEGVYAHVRHPLQVAEAIVLLASAVAFWDRWVLLYAVAAVASLLGPVRVLEETMLERRFGERARRYRREVPAFLPRQAPAATLSRTP